MHLSAEDLNQLSEKQISVEEINRQLKVFTNNKGSLTVERPCTLGDGILKLDTEQRDKFIAKYKQDSPSRKIIKFIPASGAATRMFKHLYAWDDPSFASLVNAFKKSFQDLPFLDLLSDCFTAHNLSLKQLIKENNWFKINELILESNGLGYGESPKGLIPFHKYLDHVRTAFEEHLAESKSYVSVGGVTNIHFTVSGHAQKAIENFLNARKYMFENETEFRLSYSVQSTDSDTIAVDEGHVPIRDEDDRLIFRPGGHGSLIKNLNQLDSDLIFIKNIDNILPENRQAQMVQHKMVLAGYALYLNDLRKELIGQLQMESADLDAIKSQVQNLFSVKFDGAFGLLREEVSLFLQRPIRVCGMVRNAGEPGGGPYWVKDNSGNERVQIVEKSQIDQDDAQQLKALNSSSHFNPVDIVCLPTDSEGNSLDLTEFVNPTTSFVSTKYSEGQVLKALEHPGLWNGAMADWLTVFIEVPSETFAPVKNINDLFRAEHQT
jgi:hypothetical protein